MGNGTCCANEVFVDDKNEIYSNNNIHSIQSYKGKDINKENSRLVNEESFEYDCNSVVEKGQFNHLPDPDFAPKIKHVPIELVNILEKNSEGLDRFVYDENQILTQSDENLPFLGPRQLPDQSIYIGNWKNKKRHGRGQCIYADGSVYEGYWKKDKKNGIGRLINYNGSIILEGNWKDDALEGYGTEIKKKISKYEGNWKNNKKEGNGVEIWEIENDQTERYEGVFHNGLMDGIGMFTTKDGSIYKGEFKDDMWDGNGEFFSKEGQYFKGQYVKNMMQGPNCIFRWKNGDEYSGGYKSDLKHGQGKYYFKDGEILQGEWNYGDLLLDKKITLTTKDRKIIFQIIENSSSDKINIIDTQYLKDNNEFDELSYSQKRENKELEIVQNYIDKIQFEWEMD